MHIYIYIYMYIYVYVYIVTRYEQGPFHVMSLSVHVLHSTPLSMAP